MQAALGKIALIPLTLLGWVYALAPGFLRRIMAKGVGLIPRLFRYREDIARQNLAYAFTGRAPAEDARREQVLRESYRHLGHLFFEICMVVGPFAAMPFFIKRNAEVEGIENWREAARTGKGGIFLCSHVGSWEVMAAAGALAGIPAVIVTKRLKPAWLHDWIEKGRRRSGVSGAYEPKTLSKVFNELKAGRAVGFVLDQYAGPPIGVRVPLFGVPVGTNTVVAALARRFEAPVIPISNYRLKDGRFKVVIGPPVPFRPADYTRQIAENTAGYVGLIEQDILAHPDQWLWIHRRFKGDVGPLRKEEWNEPRARK